MGKIVHFVPVGHRNLSSAIEISKDHGDSCKIGSRKTLENQKTAVYPATNHQEMGMKILRRIIKKRE